MLDEFFSERLRSLPGTRTAQAYVTGLFVKQATAPVDYSQDSVVLEYYQVRQTRELDTLQAIGDWVLWVDSVLPGALEGHRDASRAIAQASYYRCYRLVPEWRVYEELADLLPTLVQACRRSLQQVQSEALRYR